MTEYEAATLLASVLNKIQAAGHPVSIAESGLAIWVGDDHLLMDPDFDDEPWEVSKP